MVNRRYRHDTLVLESVLETASGSVRTIDFMPPRGTTPDIVRIVEGLTGSVPMTLELTIRFDYGHIVPWVRQIDDALVAIAGPTRCACGLRYRRGGGHEDDGLVHGGRRSACPLRPDVVPVASAHARSDRCRGSPRRRRGVLARLVAHLRNDGDYHEEISESLLVLKAMTFQPTGGIVAAPTTSLPEEPGGERNWDYRYCWLRDATLTLLAMLRAGVKDEAVNWRGWLLRAVAGDPADLQIMYGLSGERRLDERTLEWLPGYEGATPVRVGNAASEQLQLDVYGDVIDALYQTRRQGAPGDDNVWSLTRKLLEWLEEGWKLPDHGIWEVRGPARHFTHSKVMAWVAFDRAVRATEEWGREGPVERWRAIRDEIHAQVIERSWSDHHQAFAQSYGSDELDASVLLMAPVGFMPAADPRFVSTVSAVERELVSGGLVMRYRARADGAIDGIPSDEAAFLPCSFWLADALALIGEFDRARELFERLLDLRNELGLLSEEYDPVANRQLGNYPQAFTHLALINTAFVLREGRPLRGRG